MDVFRDLFDEPQWLLLLLLLPLLWVFSFRSLSGLGRVRRLLVLTFRSLVFLLITLALAEMQWLRIDDRITAIYLLDQSASIPGDLRAAMVDFVKESVRAHRDDSRRDRAALIVFGRDANIEIPPLDADLPILGQLETLFDLRTDATNLAAAMKLAQATFPEDSSRRVVIISDGNENMGDAQAMARLLAQDGIGIDVVPVETGRNSEVFVERVTLPPDVRKGEPFAATVVINHVFKEGATESSPVAGTIRLTRRAGETVETLSEQDVELTPGKNVLRFENQIDRPDFYEYEAVFVPRNPQDDTLAQNNRATAFTQVLGQGHILLIEDWEHRGEFDYLVDRLRLMNLQVTVRASNELFASLGELQRYDSVILANVPRSSGDAQTITNFSDEQIEMLVRNTQDMGCGLIMLGGPNSFGAGGWANTELEKAMPVDFQIYNAKVVPVGALAMVMHASEMAQGNFWQKKIAEEALKSLGPQDFCGIVHWNGNEEWLWNHPTGLARVGPNRTLMLSRLSRMTPGDMPDFDPSLRMAAAAFSRCTEAAVKHMIVISDGDPSPASMGVLRTFQQLQVKISTVAVGTHGPAGHQELDRIAKATGGNYYVVRSPEALPRIYQREARRVARPLVKETVVQPVIQTRHEILQGIDQAPPPIRGFVLTSLKQNPLVEVSLISPDPPDQRNATLLASWTYGLGRTAVLTTDAGQRWADSWTGWEGYDQLFSQLVRWSMRPTGDQGNFTVATEIEDGKVQVIVTALDQNDELLNFLPVSGSVVTPDMKSQLFPIRQTAPGRYVGQMDGEQPGSYFVTLATGPGQPVLRTGVNVPYSDEFRNRETNLALLKQLAATPPSSGKPGRVFSALTLENASPAEQVDAFRRDLAKAISSHDIWPLLVLLSSCVFFADVFLRRVNVGLEWLPPLWAKARDRLLRRPPAPEPEERLERLRQRKRQVESEIDQRRAAARFEPEPDAPASSGPLLPEAASSDQAARRAPQTESLSPEEVEPESYTERLLRAKRKAQEERDKGRP
jgi:uncharacterized membrane protein